MYFDRRLWQLTRGLRGSIVFAILLGLVASVVGIARFVILGVLLSHVFTGGGLVAVALPAVGVAAAVLPGAARSSIAARDGLAPHIATRVQEVLRAASTTRSPNWGRSVCRRAHRRGHVADYRRGFSNCRAFSANTSCNCRSRC